MIGTFPDVLRCHGMEARSDFQLPAPCLANTNAKSNGRRSYPRGYPSFGRFESWGRFEPLQIVVNLAGLSADTGKVRLGRTVAKVFGT